MNSEEKYLKQRERKAKRLSLLFRLMWVLPVKKNKIVFACFEGDGGYGDNPKYIAEELHRRGEKLDLVWLTHDVSRTFPEYIKVKKDNLWNTVYHLSTAKVWIDNYRKPYGTLKRKNQLYIQTWHATIGFKAVGLFRGDKFPEIARRVSEWDSNLADYVLSNSEYCDKVYPKKLLYNGPTLRVGSPRLDILVNSREEYNVLMRNKLGIDMNEHVVLYAPTFRGGTQKDNKKVYLEDFSIDFNRMGKAFEKKYKKNCRILLRVHPQLSAKLDVNDLYNKDGIIDVSLMPDLSEIMAAANIVITDYSSCAFDAAFVGIPVLLYADDVKEYMENRGEFMWKREDLPFDIAENNDDLEENISRFDEAKYNNKVGLFMSKNNVSEDGKASMKIVNIIFQKIKV
ncbi:CDP-glycerol glycerophosphotransferase family protein [Pseudobutyrivibrio sp. MD2005]|uniref:CDP-glycerol glycerophosphotransferase family protein n=1 Tax=Pseudobutyrivibrio sp. MD2005 TaxID=1410616 RepID=UPI00056398D6|nr:CDP-glycerol glycerophosphotransferase family protein [Pseudobutyrivibrio sp. MD2005]